MEELVGTSTSKKIGIGFVSSGCFFLGMGIGWLMGKMVIGMFVGMGIGFLVAGILSIIYKNKKMEKLMEEVKSNKKGASYLFVGCMFLGMGIGWLVGEMVIGMFIGMGVGFLCKSAISYNSKSK